MSQILSINSGPVKHFPKSIRDAKYRAFIRQFPCIVCGTRRDIEAAHFGPHGMSVKSCDSTCLPLCFDHHQAAKDSYHKNAKDFATIHNLNVEELQKMFRRFWYMKTGKMLLVEQSSQVARGSAETAVCADEARKESAA